MQLRVLREHGGIGENERERKCGKSFDTEITGGGNKYIYYNMNMHMRLNGPITPSTGI